MLIPNGDITAARQMQYIFRSFVELFTNTIKIVVDKSTNNFILILKQKRL